MTRRSCQARSLASKEWFCSYSSLAAETMSQQNRIQAAHFIGKWTPGGAEPQAAGTRQGRPDDRRRDPLDELLNI